MGVPKFFRYISERYPCLSEIVKENKLPEFDNLYLDMNGIIHVCSHPNDTDPHFRITEEKIFKDIFHYIETLFRMIQPQKLFFMAVDGVAPRAKMNQQRGRRFRSAKDAELAEMKAQQRGEKLPSDERFDSNCITPGTEFMTRLQAQLQYFVTLKISTDPLWQKVKVILSGHEVPGEGEHKIMDYIRHMKSQPNYDANTRHCLYGLDADLITLGLCTHEPHFSLLREEVKYVRSKTEKRIPTPEETTFFLLHLSLMREYLDLEFQQLKTTLPFPYDLEHIIDDWVLMGFLVGNDFIPHLPNMHINKGALPILYSTYIKVLPTLGGFINEGGTLRLDRFQKYMEKLAAFDLEQFKESSTNMPDFESTDMRYFESKTGHKMGGREQHCIFDGSKDDNYIEIDSDKEKDEDDTCFAEFSAHKKNYYMAKLEYEDVTPEVLRYQGEVYVRAIQWNLNYYYNGCCSWSWFYPHHYAPYCSDINNFSSLTLEYDLGKPFLPFQQLLAVLPAASKKLLPAAYHDLMEGDDSPIIDFYPKEFTTDLNGKRQDWEAVVLIPFIDQVSLLNAMATKEQELTDEEKQRNKHGPMQIFTYNHENLGTYPAPAYFDEVSCHHAQIQELSREQLYVEPAKLIKGLCPGVKLEVYYSGFPMLKHIPFKAALDKAKVKVFEFASRGDNMILTILPQGQPAVADVASQLLGKSVYVNWPHLFEARVISVANLQTRFSLKAGDETIMQEEMTKPSQEKWQLARQEIETKYLSRMGIDVGNTEILVYACTLEDNKYVLADDKMRREKQWASYPIAYALQTTRTNIAVHEPETDLVITIEKMFPPGRIVFVLDQQHYGTQGRVLEIAKNKRVKVSVTVDSEPNLEQVQYKSRRVGPHYKPGNKIASQVKISPHLLSRITGTIYILTGDIQDEESNRHRKLNIGLNLKFSKRNEEVCGYTRRNNNNYWQYSDRAADEVAQYKNRFPEVFKFLAEKGFGDDIRDSELYPEDTERKLKELSEWLKERGSNSAERQKCGAETLSEEVVQILEGVVDKHLENKSDEKTDIIYVKPSNLYVPKPKLGQAPDTKVTRYQLYDRVVSIRESHTVPLGYKGTVIGIHMAEDGAQNGQRMYDILFDKVFTGGLKIRSSPNRAYRLPAQGLINLSHSLPSDSSRTQGKPTTVIEPSSDPPAQQSPVSGAESRGRRQPEFSSKARESAAHKALQVLVEDRVEDHKRATTSALINLSHSLCSDSSHTQGEPTALVEPSSDNISGRFLEMRRKSLMKMKLSQERCHKSVIEATPNPQPTTTSQGIEEESSTWNNNSHNSAFVNCNRSDQSSKVTDPPAQQSPVSGAESRGRRQPKFSKPQKPLSKHHSYCTDLFSFSLHKKRWVKLPRYHFYDTPDGLIVCTVVCENDQEFRGEPAHAKEQAAESAAHKALQVLDNGEEDHKRGGRGMGPMPFHSANNPPQRPPFPQSKRMASNRSRTDPLPPPPPDNRANNFRPDPPAQQSPVSGAESRGRRQPEFSSKPQKPLSKRHSYCTELFSFSLHKKRWVKLPQYHYYDTPDGLIVCTVVCENDQEYRGEPAHAKEQAAESAAHKALQVLDNGEEDHKRGGRGMGPMPFHSANNPPQRPPFPQSKRMASNRSRTDPLPPPPPDNRANNFRPDQSAQQSPVSGAENRGRRQPEFSSKPQKPLSKHHSYCTELFSFSLHKKRWVKLPRYHYYDTPDGLIVCTVVCENDQEFRGEPAHAKEPARESAAQKALQVLDNGEEDHTRGGQGMGPMPFHSANNPPRRPPFPQSNRMASNNRSCPTRSNHFRPEWRGNNNKVSNTNFCSPPQAQRYQPPLHGQPGEGQYRQRRQHTLAESGYGQLPLPPQPEVPQDGHGPAEHRPLPSNQESTPQEPPPGGPLGLQAPRRSRIAAKFNSPLSDGH